MTTFVYPEARRDETVVDDYHGQKIPDPYRWLEDPDSQETKEFVDKQNAVTVPFLESCPVRQKLNKRITELYDYPKYGCPFKRGKHYFYYYNTGLQNQSVLFVQDSLDGEAREFLDPNKLSEDGTVSINGSDFSEDGRYFAYGLSASGSDWITIHFRDVDTGKELPDVLTRVKFSCITWTHDNSGIFYNKYPEEDGKCDGTETVCNLNQKIMYHRLGTDQSQDVLCAEWPDHPKWMGSITVSDCGHYILCEITEGCDPVNQLYFCELSSLPKGITGKLPLTAIVDNFEAEYQYVTNEESIFTFKTNFNSPHYKLINIDFNNFSQENWLTLVPEDGEDVLETVTCVNQDKLVLCYLHDVKSVLRIHDLTSGRKISDLPLDIGCIQTVNGKKKHTEIFYQFISFLSPGIIYRCAMNDIRPVPTVFRETKVKDIDANNFITKQVFYPADNDPNIKIPMFVVHKKSLKLDSSNPVYLYGYGGFNISITPTYSASRVVFMNHLNGILAVANIRGGGEYGDTWHKAGTMNRKQNVFNDFQGAARYLVEQNYTAANKIAIVGGSNGGLLVAACANQRPELFGCVIGQVGVMDMLRFHKFTIGHAWTTDFGCADIKEQFQWLVKYSPLHNISVPDSEVIQYPAMLLLTGDHDDRVVPLHSLKFIAQLQHVFKNCKKQTNPLLIRVDTKSGHGFGKPTAKQIEELTEIYSFISLCLKLKWCD